MQPIKTLSDFKKLVQLGTQIGCVYHMAFAGRNGKNEIQYKDEERPIREVSIRQTNSFALKTQKTDGTWQDQWLQWPKASECKIVDNKLTIYEEERPVLTYWIV